MSRYAAALGVLALAFSVAPARAGDDPNAINKLTLDEVIARARSGGASSGSSDPRKFRDFKDVTDGATVFNGLFTLHKKDEHLYAEIKPFQFDVPLLAPIAIARGLGQVGQPMNFGDEWVILFKRVGDRVQLVRRNIHFKATPGTPLEKAVKQNFTDSVIQALPIVALNPMGQSVLVDFSDIFLNRNFAELPFGGIDPSRSNWSSIKAFANNLELQVEATFTGGRFFGGMFGGTSPVADDRGLTVVIHYSLMKLPDPGYRPRMADNRVGHFLSAAQDFGQTNPEGNFVRMVQRWRLEKADPRAKLSPPKKQLIWYVEENVPVEYRPFVQDGILEWNKAFEMIGFRDALAVRWAEPGRDDFDPEDTNYCTFRWIATNSTFAMSALRANPLTGEMIDGDVIFDESWIRAWKQEYALLTGSPLPTGRDDDSRRVLAVGEVISPILAAKQGYGLLNPPAGSRLATQAAQDGGMELVPSGLSEVQLKLRRHMAQGGACQYAAGMRHEMGLTALALAAGGKAEDAGKLPEELIGQAIKEVVMHEVGHSLGLRHNFKASTMLTADQLNDTAITRAKGMVGSVMDYSPINIAPKGKAQGDYFTTTIGPYDYWAIEYAYKQFPGDEDGELKKIASRAPEHDLAFATDGDLYGNDDPTVNLYDLGSDPCQFARDRIALAVELIKDLDAKAIRDGESWVRVREAFSILLAQFGNGAALVGSHVGGQSVYRDRKGDKDARDPVVPTPGPKQREALAFLVENILSDKSFQFSPALLRRLGTEKWYHWGEDSEMSGVEYPIYDRVLGIQKIALSQCLDPGVLRRIQNQQIQADPASDPLKMAEVFRALTDGIWAECASADADKTKPVACSTIRRNLQREHIKRLATMVLGTRRNAFSDIYAFVVFSNAGSTPADARALARLHLKLIGEKVTKILDQKDAPVDDTTRAHLEECRYQIAKVLDANSTTNEP